MNQGDFAEVTEMSNEQLAFYLQRMGQFLAPHRFLPFDQLILREASKRLSNDSD